MVITLEPETSQKLREQAEREGEDVNHLANVLLAAALEWEQRDREEAVAGIQRGLDAVAADRIRPAADVLADLRARLAAHRE